MHRSKIVLGFSVLAVVVLLIFCSKKIALGNASFSLEDASIQEEVSNIACALSEGQVCFDFDDLLDIPPICLKGYAASRREDFLPQRNVVKTIRTLLPIWIMSKCFKF